MAMFKPNKLQKTIDRLLDQMENADPTSKEYSQMADQLYRLMESKDKNYSAVSKGRDTAIIAGTNLAGILVIANYEKAAVWTTKAFVNILKK